MKTMERELEKALRSIRFQKFWTDLVNTLFLFTLFGIFLLILFLLFSMFPLFFLSVDTPILSIEDVCTLLLGLGASGAIVALGAALVKRWSATDLSYYVDGQLGGAERCISALEIARLRRISPMESRVLRDAVDLLYRAQREGILPLARIWNRRILVFLVLFALFLGLVPIYRWEMGRRGRHSRGPAPALQLNDQETAKAMEGARLHLFSGKEVLKGGEPIEAFLRVTVDEECPFNLAGTVHMMVSRKKQEKRISLLFPVVSKAGEAFQQLFFIDGDSLLEKAGILPYGEVTFQALLVPNEEGSDEKSFFQGILLSNPMRITFSTPGKGGGGSGASQKKKKKDGNLPAGKGNQEGKLALGEGKRRNVRRERKFIEPKVGEGADIEKETFSLEWKPKAGQSARPEAPSSSTVHASLEKRVEEFIRKHELTQEEAWWVRRYFTHLREKTVHMDKKLQKPESQK